MIRRELDSEEEKRREELKEELEDGRDKRKMNG